MDERLRPELKRLIDEGTIKLGDKSLCTAFNDFIVAEYPWIANHILWNQVNDVVEFKLMESGIEVLRDIIYSTRLARHENIAMVYSVFHECLFTTLEFLIENEELLTAQGFPQCYFVGVEYKNGDPYLMNEDFVEYEWSDGFWLRGRKRTI